jgi:pimeloyl-ACP methyl ester carboxylesterase
LAIGRSYDVIGEHRDEQTCRPEGKLVDVHGHEMHVYGQGQGRVTVVFAPGLHSPTAYADFYPLHSRLVKRTRVALYDRPGHGFSEATRDPRSIDTMVGEIRTALGQAGEKAPYLFVAHSLGTLEALRYAQLFPAEVGGIVSLDGGSPAYYAQADLTSDARAWLMLRGLKWVGLARLAVNHGGYLDRVLQRQNGLSLVPPAVRSSYAILTLRSLGSSNVADEARQAQANARVAILAPPTGTASPQGNLRLRILTADSSIAEEAGWLESQRAFAAISPDATQVTLPHTRHSIHHYAPDVVEEVIVELLDCMTREQTSP